MDIKFWRFVWGVFTIVLGVHVVYMGLEEVNYTLDIAGGVLIGYGFYLTR